MENISSRVVVALEPPHGDGWEMIHKAAHNTEYFNLQRKLKRNPECINKVDQYGNNALHILIRYGDAKSPAFQDCVEVLLENGIDVNHKNIKNVCPIMWARRRKLNSQIIQIIESQTGKTSSENNDMGDILMEYLKRGAAAEEEFINYNNGNIKTWIAENPEKSYSLLRMCCSKGLSKAAIHLIDSGVDPESCTTIFMAAENGNKEIFKAMLDKTTKISGALLPTIVKYIDRKQHDNIGCYKIFMNKMEQLKKSNRDEVAYILNQGDEKGNTALHYAVFYAEPNVIEELLNFGASLGAKNNECVMPIENIDADILKNHLDKCIEFEMANIKKDDEKLQVKINYRSLIPPYVQIDGRNTIENNNINVTYTEREAFIGNKTIHKVAETEVIHSMSEAPKIKELLRHPTITSLLYLKWWKIQRIFRIYLAYYIIFASSLSLYIYSDLKPDKSTLWIRVDQTLHIILSIMVILIVFKELVKITVTTKMYTINIENCIEFFLVFFSIPIVLNVYAFFTKREYFAITILLLSFRLVFVLGHHPKLSTNVVMFKTVSYNFYKYLILYFIPITAFAIGLFLVMTDNKPFASDVTDAIFKIVIMITGEFNSDNLNFVTYPITSKLIFTVFVYTFAIILLNLLNGLAVNDTQKIQSDAELEGYKAQIKFIRGIETMLMRITFIVTQVQKVFARTNHSLDWNSLGQFLLRLSCIFPDCYDYKLTFYPRLKNVKSTYSDFLISFIYSNKKPKYMDHNTVQGTNKIIQDKVNAERQNKIMEEMQKETKTEIQVTIMEKLQKQNEEMLKKINEEIKITIKEKIGVMQMRIQGIDEKINRILKSTSTTY